MLCIVVRRFWLVWLIWVDLASKIQSIIVNVMRHLFLKEFDSRVYKYRVFACVLDEFVIGHQCERFHIEPNDVFYEHLNDKFWLDHFAKH